MNHEYKYNSCTILENEQDEQDWRKQSVIRANRKIKHAKGTFFLERFMTNV